jgi:copper chaperone CopZ
MKYILTLILITLTTFIHAADKPSYTYEGEIAGVVCSACSKHVRAALTKIDGVTDVKITLGKEGALPHLTVISTSPSLTKEAAIKALGDNAKMYVIQSLALSSK